MMTFFDKIATKWAQDKYVCVGLDPMQDKLPENISSFFEFNKQIIDKTFDLVNCYKPNSAFYEAQGVEGILDLKKTISYIHEQYPNIAVLLDAKRGDIDSTNDGYVKFIFDYLGSDAVTIHPYLGREANMPFLKYEDKGIFILCKTSNIGSDEFQNIDDLYLKVAGNVSRKWNTNNNCGLVVGATYPEELKRVREIDSDLPILIPGIGAQGGDLEKTVEYAKKNFIISSSRGIIFASSGDDFAEAARTEVNKLNEQIVRYI